MRRPRFEVLALFVFCTVVLFVSGCGSKQGGAFGRVTYKGKELTHGTVVFHGKNGIPVNAAIDGSGNYEVKGVAAGETMVTVVQLPKDHKSPAELRKEYEAAGKKMSPELFAPPKSLIPVRYNNAETSNLKVTITSGKVNFDIPLVD